MTKSFVISSHLLSPAHQCPSPNQSERPPEATIKLLVIHNISLPPGEFGGGHVDSLFCNCLDPDLHPFFREICELKVSAHLFIDRDGQVTQYVPFNRKAWHAGKSCFDGEENCNDYSIGIELEGADDQEFTDLQYRALIDISNLLMREYPAITLGRIVGHSDIAPGRKTDPGPCFDWARLRDGLHRS